jgi:phage terminase small subunit
MSGEKDTFNFDDDELGPAMLELDPRRREFVRAVMRLKRNGIQNVSQAARQAGYSDHKEGCKVRGHHLIQSPRIQAALLEESRKAVNAAACCVATPVVIEIALDKKAAHRDRLHAAEMLFNRGGMPAQTEHKVTVEHRQPKQMLELAERLAKELDLDPVRLLGINRAAATVIEGEVVRDDNAALGD